MADTSKPFITICSQCACQVAIPALAHRQRASCPRCGHHLGVHRRYAAQSCAAFAISALIALSLSLPFNFLSFRTQGQHHDIDLPAGIGTLFANDGLTLGIITVLATLVLPGLMLLLMVMVCFAHMTALNYRYLHRLRRMISAIAPWSMAEIFLVGMLVSLVKLTSMADITIGISFYAYAAFAFFTVTALVYFESADLYHRANQPSNRATWVVAKPLNVPLVVQRSWALLATAVLLYVPANTLPIMQMQILHTQEPSTIVSGVLTLWQTGSYGVAIIIFMASVFVPIAKILVLAWLTYSVQIAQSSYVHTKMRYYRIVEWIGRWSMIDVFVVALLVALVQLGGTLSIHPGPAALAFCAVVFITMVAAMTFDVRVFWYHQETSS